MVKLNALVMFYVYNLLIGPRPLQRKGLLIELVGEMILAIWSERHLAL